MNNINFAKKSISSKKISSYTTSVVFIITIFLAIIVLQIKQWKTLHDIKRKKSIYEKKVESFNETLEKKRKLKQKSEYLKKKFSKLERVENNPHVYFSLFSYVNQLLQNNGSLSNVTIFRKKIDLSITYPDIKKATEFMNSMIKSPYISHLKLISIHPEENYLIFKMSGKLT